MEVKLFHNLMQVLISNDDVESIWDTPSTMRPLDSMLDYDTMDLAPWTHCAVSGITCDGADPPVCPQRRASTPMTSSPF